MSIVDILRKLGILRYGGKAGTYTNATNRPTEFQMEGVYNADKDLVTKQDVKNVVAAATGKPGGGRGCLTALLVGLGVLGVLVVLIIVLAIIGSSGDGKKSEQPTAEATTESNPVAEQTAVRQDQPAESPRKEWDPKTGEEAAAVPAGFKYGKYANPKFGFVTELPAHWESSVKDNAQLFCGAKGTEEFDTTINFQIIVKKPGSTLKSEADDLLAQWKVMDGFNLDKSDQGDLNGSQALYMVASYELPGGRSFQQMQTIIDREPYYYMIGYTAPKKLFMKYYFVMVHLIGTFQFTAIQK